MYLNQVQTLIRGMKGRICPYESDFFFTVYHLQSLFTYYMIFFLFHNAVNRMLK
jgi:hypothetical protein